MKRNVRWPAALALIVAGCGSIQMTVTGPVQAPKPPNCEFIVLAAVPKGSWTEVAIIDTRRGVGLAGYSDIESFTRAIRSKVCAAGGDAAVAMANDTGKWIKATVLVRGEAPPAVAASASAPAASKPPGCVNDMGCKGDRICIEGECVAPSEPTPPSADSGPSGN